MKKHSPNPSLNCYMLILQAVNTELEEAITDRETHRAQIQEYIAEVSRIEDLLAQKVTTYTLLNLFLPYNFLYKILSVKTIVIIYIS